MKYNTGRLKHNLKRGTCIEWVNMADRAWKQFKENIKQKRGAKRKAAEKGVSATGEIIVQRLSATVSGKAQKYSRVGAREFVPFDQFEELTVENVKEACEQHFTELKESEDLVCDVLAGEQGPSCRTIGQIPDQKVFHVRFIHANTLGDRSSVNKVKPVGPARPSTNATKSVPVHTVSSVAQKTTASKVYPKSLSVVDMLKLGKKIEQSSSTIDIFKFSISHMTWSKVESGVEFNISREPFASGTVLLESVK